MDAQQKRSISRSRTMHRAYTRKLIEQTTNLLKESSENFEKIEDDLLTNQNLLKEKLEILKDLDEKYTSFIEDDAELEMAVIECNDLQRLVLKSAVSIDT